MFSALHAPPSFFISLIIYSVEPNKISVSPRFRLLGVKALLLRAKKKKQQQQDGQ